MKNLTLLLVLFAFMQISFGQNNTLATVNVATQPEMLDSVTTDNLSFELHKAYGWSDAIGLSLGCAREMNLIAEPQKTFNMLTLDLAVGARFEYGGTKTGTVKNPKSSLLLEADLCLALLRTNPLACGRVMITNVTGWSRTNKLKLIVGFGAELNVLDGINFRPVIRGGVEYKNFFAHIDMSANIKGSRFQNFMPALTVGYRWSIKKVFDSNHP